MLIISDEKKTAKSYGLDILECIVCLKYLLIERFLFAKEC